MQSSGSFRLIVRRGPQPNQIYELNKDVISLGRDITNDIVINDPEVSRHHTKITRGGGGYTLEDLGSTNGTFVNGQRLTGARPLNGGDLVGLGETVTLSYETAMIPAQMAGPAPGAGTMVGQSPLAQNPYAQPQAGQAGQPAPGQPGQPGYPANAQQPAPPPGYAAPPPPPPQYQPPEQPAQQNSALRWVFLGCGCLLVLCILVTVVGLFYIDSNRLYCTVPVVKQIVTILVGCPATGS